MVASYGNVGIGEIEFRADSPTGGDLLGSGDLARPGRSRSYGDLDLLLRVTSAPFNTQKVASYTLAVILLYDLRLFVERTFSGSLRVVVIALLTASCL